jgi:hypothetical protein
MEREISLTFTAKTLAKCWTDAEKRIRLLVQDKYWAPSEEDLTFLLRGELRAVIREASKRKDFERAFEKDLQNCPEIVTTNLRAVVTGLMGSVSFHGRYHEGHESAADLAIVIRRPKVTLQPGKGAYIFKDYPRALLVQAKLGRPKPMPSGGVVWQPLTKHQADRIPLASHHYALLLYRWSDPDGEQLEPIKWKPCANFDTTQISNWLATNKFDGEQDSKSIIEGIALGKLGTADKEVIRSADPGVEGGCRALHIRLHWPDGHSPPATIPVHIRQTQQRVVAQIH